jgi:hypothetical protein
MNIPRMLGIALQAVVLGTLLFLAIVKMTALSSNLHLFQYEGF